MSAKTIVPSVSEGETLMQANYQSQSHLAPNSDVPFATHQGILERLASHDQARVKRLGRDAAKAEQVAQLYAKDLVGLMGAKKYKMYRAHIASERQSMTDRLRSTEGLRMSPEARERLAAERLQKSLAYLEKLGIDPAKLEKVRRDAGKRSLKLQRSFAGSKSKPGALLSPADFPPGIRARKTNPWTLYGPVGSDVGGLIPKPYGGWFWAYWYWFYGAPEPVRFVETPDMEWHRGKYTVDYRLGWLQNRNPVIYYAGDGTVFHRKGYTAVGIWHRMLNTGLITVMPVFQSTRSQHHLFLDYQWAPYSAQSIQRGSFTLKVTSADWSADDFDSTAEIVAIENIVFADADRSFDQARFSIAESVGATLSSSRPFERGTDVVIEVGMLTDNFAYAFDPAVESTMDYGWFAKEVWVEG